MAEAGNPVTPSHELLEWPKQDKRRFLHAVYRVGDLERTIKFYTECLGMKLLRKRDVPEEKYANAFLVYEIMKDHNIGTMKVATADIKTKGGTITREPGPVKGGSTVIAFAKDPDGYLFELIQRGPTPEPLCQVMLRVGDLERSIKFYEKALGMRLLKKTDRPEQKYTIAMMGYADEYETTVLELTYNYGVTEYTKGTAYAQIVTQELGGKITREPGPVPGINTKITSFLDPDGWKTSHLVSSNVARAKLSLVLVDHEDFLKEL
ncbi:Lactoylglutathione lyase GLX1 [Sesamum angolense]|uniref:Lactoylglutathione lyase GLX1 n=1 Tax=Sesamum angolense TaxID=2727404 RepID=A0AAE1WTJ2_9LAMI|nr:Lactoylglutathione lyase GLX1 [Sesamum angolense]